MIIAVIPARGGSKRIPHKNIKLFGGKPMVAWSIEAAQKTGLFDRIIVSTDDNEIADVAKKYGADVPFMRPSELSDDYTGTSPVIAHAIEWLLDSGFEPTLICCIYATAPFIQVQDIERGKQTLELSGADFAFSVTSYPFPIQRAIQVNLDGRVEMFDPSQFTIRSQDLSDAFHDAGQFYWGTREAWLSGVPIFGQNSAAILISRYLVQDIDTAEDWEEAEIMFKALKFRENE